MKRDQLELEQFEEEPRTRFCTMRKGEKMESGGGAQIATRKVKKEPNFQLIFEHII